MLALAFGVALTEHLLLFSYSPLASDIMGDLNLSHAEAGILFSASLVALALLRIPWGVLADRVGFRLATGIAMIFMSAFGLLRGFSYDYVSLLMTQIFMGIGMAAAIPCLPKIISEWFPPEETGLATGIYMAGFAIGNMIGLAVTPHLLDQLGDWRITFRLYGFIAVGLTLLWFLFSRGRQTSKNEGKKVFRSLSRAVRMREVWILTGLFICTSGCYDTICTWLPYALKARGVSAYEAGFVSSMLPLGFLVSSPVIGALSDHFGSRRPLIAILGMVSGPAILATGIATGIPLWTSAFLIGFTTLGALTLVLAIPVDSEEIRPVVSSAVGIISSVGNLGSILLPVGLGYLIDLTGDFFPGILLLAVTAEGILLLSQLLGDAGTTRK